MFQPFLTKRMQELLRLSSKKDKDLKDFRSQYHNVKKILNNILTLFLVLLIVAFAYQAMEMSFINDSFEDKSGIF